VSDFSLFTRWWRHKYYGSPVSLESFLMEIEEEHVECGAQVCGYLEYVVLITWNMVSWKGPFINMCTFISWMFTLNVRVRLTYRPSGVHIQSTRLACLSHTTPCLFVQHVQGHGVSCLRTKVYASRW